MVFNPNPTEDFLIQEKSAKRLVPNPNRLNNLTPPQSAANTVNQEEAIAGLINASANANSYNDLLTHLIVLGGLKIPKSKQYEVFEHIKHLDLEIAEKKQQYLQNILAEHQLNHQIIQQAMADEQAFKFNPQKSSMLKLKRLLSNKYRTLLYLLIWLAVIVVAWVYTSPLPKAYLLGVGESFIQSK